MNNDNAVRYNLTNKSTGEVYPMIDGSGSFGDGTVSFDIMNNDVKETVSFKNDNGTLTNDEWEANEATEDNR